jgi:hypothetical protein
MYSNKLITVAIVALSVFASAVEGYLQLSSSVTQKHTAAGIFLKFGNQDAIDTSLFAHVIGSDSIKFKVAGTYFVIAAPQVGFNSAGTCSSATSYFADYWVVVNGAAVANSNVRLQAAKTHKDVIVTQGVGIFAANDVMKIEASGKCSLSEYIKPAGEPVIPSVILTVFKL